MRTLEAGSHDDVLFRGALGLAVLGIAMLCANFASLPIDFTMFEARLADPEIKRAFIAGYTMQLATGSGLAMALVLDARRLQRPALYAWFVSLCLLFVPVPPVIRNPESALLPVLISGIAALIGWALDESLREEEIARPN
jgi:hypothetical protein